METLPHSIAGKRLFALREGARRGLVRNAARESLIKRVHVPLDLLVGRVHVVVRQDHRRKRRVGRVGDEPCISMQVQINMNQKHKKSRQTTRNHATYRRRAPA